GSRFSASVGLASAALFACRPAVLFPLMQPMIDATAAASWVLAAAFVSGETPRAPLAAGLATSAAILVRPNLLPLGIVIGLFLLLRGVKPALIYAAASAPGCVAVAAIQQVFYGSP